MRAPFFVSASCLAVVLLLSPSRASAGAVDGVQLRLVASGFDSPVEIAHAGDERTFVVEQSGRIRIVADGAVVEAPFLDIRDRVLAGGERGLLGLAFHPAYAANGRFFVNYTREGDGATVVSRFERSAGNPDRADAGSEAVLLVVAQPFSNHNGGHLAFGRDGHLYVGMGDGGSGGDPDCRSQNRDDLLGKMLRLDVDTHADAPPFHAVPPDNPYAGAVPGADLVWALGLRNPWRFSFDRKRGDLLLADVGQNAWDEIDFLPYGSAPANFGWRVMEGNACYSRDGCPGYTPACGAPELTRPIFENALGGGLCAVIGGYVYRGHRLPELEGGYLFGDYCSGRIWFAARDPFGAWNRVELPFELEGLTTFGETNVGEVLLATQSGSLYTLDRPVATSCGSPVGVCLRGRFLVEVSVRDYLLDFHYGRIALAADDSALFYYFSSANWEQIVKVIDGCTHNGHFWVYGAAASDVEAVIRVTDTARGVVREYRNPLGRQTPALTDSSAFATCP